MHKLTRKGPSEVPHVQLTKGLVIIGVVFHEVVEHPVYHFTHHVSGSSANSNSWTFSTNTYSRCQDKKHGQIFENHGFEAEELGVYSVPTRGEGDELW